MGKSVVLIFTSRRGSAVFPLILYSSQMMNFRKAFNFKPKGVLNLVNQLFQSVQLVFNKASQMNIVIQVQGQLQISQLEFLVGSQRGFASHP